MAKTPEVDIRDSLVGNNLIINGDMNIAQRGTSFSTSLSSAYTLDRWQYRKTVGSTMALSISKDSDAPTFAQSGQYFSSSLRMNLTIPQDSLSAGHAFLIEQKIEGYNFAKIAFKAFTLSFWVKSTTIGIRTISFRNSLSDRSYVSEYTINAANTWERKVITVSASPSSGTWDYGTGVGLVVTFSLACGSTFQTTKDTWQTGNFFGTAAAGNGVATGSTDFRITGVMLNEGVEALPFSLAGGNLTGELQLCQRYYEKSYNIEINPGASTTVGANAFSGNSVNNIISTIGMVRKRGIPVVVTYQTGGTSGYGTTSNIGERSFSWSLTGATSTSVHWTADAEL